MGYIVNLKEVKKILVRKSLYDFIKEFWDAYETDAFIDHWLIEFQSECFMYSVKHFLPNYIYKDWISDEEYERIKTENNAFCPVRDKMFNGKHVHNHDWNISPRHMKSSIFNVCGPVWLGINTPIKVASVSHTKNLSDEMNTKRQTLLNSDKFQYYFKNDTDLELVENTSTSLRLKSGTQLYSVCMASFTGFGADLILADDLISSENARKDKQVLKNANEFFRKTLPTRLNSKVTGVVWQIQQRLARNDISGNILRDKELSKLYSHTELQAISTKDDFTLIYPCSGKIKTIKKGDKLWEERFGDYTQVKIEVGENEFETQYQQNPRSSDFNVITDDMIHYIEDNEYKEFKEMCDVHYASHDCPVKDKEESDFHGFGGGWGKNAELVIDEAWEKKLAYVAEKQLMLDLQTYDPSLVQIVEDKANGAALLQDLHKDIGSLVDFEPQGRSKMARLELAAMYMKKGNVKFYKNTETEYLIQQLLNYPNVKNDDIIDAFSQMVIYHFTQRFVGVYTGAFGTQNIVPEVQRDKYDVFYEFAATIKGDTIKVIAINRDLALGTFTVEKEWVFTSVEKFEEFYRENVVRGNLFIDASINSRLKSIIFNVGYIESFKDKDTEASINLIRSGFYNKKILVCKDCVNTKNDIAKLRFTNTSAQEGTNKLDSADEGFAGCIRALITYDMGYSKVWY